MDRESGSFSVAVDQSLRDHLALNQAYITYDVLTLPNTEFKAEIEENRVLKDYENFGRSGATPFKVRDSDGSDLNPNNLVLAMFFKENSYRMRPDLQSVLDNLVSLADISKNYRVLRAETQRITSAGIDIFAEKKFDLSPSDIETLKTMAHNWINRQTYRNLERFSSSYPKIEAVLAILMNDPTLIKRGKTL
jgi:hypothetical protein